MSWVWSHSSSKGTERLILLAIADNARDDGSDAYPSIETLARKAGGLDERTVQRAITRLVELGELEVTEGGGRGRSNRYRVVMRNPGAAPVNPGDFAPNPGGIAPKPRQDATRTILEPSENHPESLRDSGAEIATTDEEAYTAQTVVAAFVDRCPQRPPGKVIGHLSRLIKEMIEEGVPKRALWTGLLEWGARGLHPSALPSVVNAAMNRGQVAINGTSTTEQRAAAAVAAGVEAGRIMRERGLVT